MEAVVTNRTEKALSGPSRRALGDGGVRNKCGLGFDLRIGRQGLSNVTVLRPQREINLADLGAGRSLFSICETFRGTGR